ncbi:protein kinase-like domain-containing protein [Xylariomycetidae sp. FL0641]|nr:protein kinase-like domain-containing protein [Xylariomycetidae sp. FL0641]
MEANMDGVREFLTDYGSQRPATSLPELCGPGLEPHSQEPNTNNHGDSDVGSRVLDYGTNARAEVMQRNQEPPPGHRDDLLGLNPPVVDEPPHPTEDMQSDLSAIRETPKLGEALKEALVDCAEDETKSFLPLGQLEELCQEVTVRAELVQALNKHPSSIIDGYVRAICGDPHDPRVSENSCRKIFAILVLNSQTQEIEGFLRKNIQDRHLPFRKEYAEGHTTDFNLVRRATLDTSESVPTSCFEGWKLTSKKEFWVKQWTLLAPYIAKAADGSVAFYDLDQQAIMPWTQANEAPNTEDSTVQSSIRNGGYSKVTQVTIHSDHHDFHECSKFAVKTLYSSDPLAFKREFDNLKRIETQGHLVQLYAAFKRGVEYSFLFPWADGGNLSDLWKRDPRAHLQHIPSSDQAAVGVKWLAQQFAGLAGKSGLAGLHDTKLLPSSDLLLPVVDPKEYGIHGDIKAENILCFENRADQSHLGTLKIADFGLTGFHSMYTRSLQPPTSPCSPTYRAPEYEIKDRYLTRKFDIWSLGCVFSQFMTWFILGPEAVRQFDEKRFKEVDLVVADQDASRPLWNEDRFFKKVPAPVGLAVKDSVRGWIEDLIRHVEGTEPNYLQDCLEFIKDHMLVAKHEERAECNTVSNFLDRASKRCLNEPAYTEVDLPSLRTEAEERGYTALGSDIKIVIGD